MEYNLTPEQALFRDTTRSFLEKESPLTRVRELAASPVGFDPEWWRRGADVTATGVAVTRDQSLDLVRRLATVRLDEVRVPRSGLVGAPGEGAAAAGRQLQAAVALQCAELTGVAGRVFEFTVQWAFDRYSFGRPLASYQALKHRFADMRLWLEAAQAAAGAAARAVGDGGPEAAELSSVAKAYIGERATDIIQDCVQLHGGIGVTWEHDIHLYLRRATVDRALWGTPSEHRRLLADILNV